LFLEDCFFLNPKRPVSYARENPQRLELDMATREQIQTIAAAANCFRPDWPVASLATYLAKSHASRPFEQLALAVMAIAVDPATKNPSRLAENGPWWKAAHTAATGGVPTETPGPGAEPACNRVGHEHELARHCRACAAERHADTEADARPLATAPPPPEIVAVAERHRRRTAAGGRPEPRSFAQTEELRQPDPFAAVRCARRGCGGFFVDDPAGRQAHQAVFAHTPVRPPVQAVDEPR
jgi:hypothetical protein